MKFQDYYKVLGVAGKADPKEIKRAYRRLARQYHPDINPNDKVAEERFKEINEAYEVLSDPQKRKKYDNFGCDWQRFEQSGMGGFDSSQWQQQGNGPYVRYTSTKSEDINFEDLFGNGGFSDVFSSMFGGASERSTPRARRGQDYEHPLEITLREAYQGTSRVVNREGRQLEVKIPAGVKTGSKVRVGSGKGGTGVAGGQAGDLYLLVKVLADPRFEPKGDHLHTEIEIPLYTAMLGGEATVPTLNGNLKLTIPPGTQNGRRFRLRGKGMPKLKGSAEYGDLYATVKVRLPTQLNQQERNLFEQLRNLRQDR
ncbi:MAG: DnaJ C-terminal domain-containing protein [Ardenticatenaceae bacterium]